MVSKDRNRSRPGVWAKVGKRRAAWVGVFSLLVLAVPAYDALAAQPPVSLGTAGSFAVLAGSTVTNTGASRLNGDLGVAPGTAVTGFPPGIATGATHYADAVAAQAQSDLTTAYNDTAGRTPVVDKSGDLGGLTLTSGVYKSASSLGLTGTLTLDAQGNPDAVFVFQTGSTLTTASASSITLINGAQACNVYWQVGSSATLGTASSFVGNILAYTSISMNNGVTVAGRALARNGAVTLINDTITPSACAANAGTTTTTTTTAGTTTTTGTTTTGTTTTGTNGSGTGKKGTGKRSTKRTHHGTATLTTVPHSVATTINRYGTNRCVIQAFRVAVTGRSIRRVVFSLGTRVVAQRSHSPFQATVTAVGGIHIITARVTFTDATRPIVRHIRYRACAAAALKATPPAPPITTVGFTG
jgi:hypothetical protein